MTRVVVDASAIMATLLPDEQGPIADLVLSTLETSAIAVPQHWPLEVANAILTAARRKRLTEEQLSLAANKAEAVLAGATIHPITRIADILELAMDFGLTAYDSAYVQLARRLKSPLLTSDRQMRTAAAALAIPLLP